VKSQANNKSEPAARQTTIRRKNFHIIYELMSIVHSTSLPNWPNYWTLLTTLGKGHANNPPLISVIRYVYVGYITT